MADGFSDSAFRELSRTVRQDRPGVRVGEATLLTPEGTQVTRHYLHAPDAVAVVAVVDGDLLLVREYRAAVGVDMVQVPMGKVTGGRDPLVCAHAELAEETGYRASRCLAVGTLLSCPGWMDQQLHVYRAEDLTSLAGRPRSDDPDDIEERYSSVVRVAVDRFGDAIRSGLVRDARTIAAVQLALG